MEIRMTQGLPMDARLIREEVFEMEQEFQEEFDCWEDVSLHAVLYQEGNPVATARMLLLEDGKTYKIGRIAVRQPYRGQGLGRRMVEVMEEKARELGGSRAELSAQVQAIGFYEKLGYRSVGEIYYEEHVPHVKMVKELSKNLGKNSKT